MDVTALTKLKMKYFNGSKDELLQELPDLVRDPDIRKRRKAEINILVELDQYYEGAQIMLKMKKMFLLKGDFTDLEKIVKAVSKWQPSEQANSLQLYISWTQLNMCIYFELQGKNK